MFDDENDGISARTTTRRANDAAQRSCCAQGHWLSVGEARARLAEEADRFFQEVLAHVPNGCDLAPALALRASAGLGKTTIMLALIARYGWRLLERGSILIYVPTLDLAERARAEFDVLGSGLPSVVLRGRDGVSSVTGKRLCARHADAAALAKIAGSVTSKMCQGRGSDGKMVQADCRLGCGYFWQFGGLPKVVFLAHAYLKSYLPLPGEIALRVIDEAFFSTLLSEASLSAGEWLDPSAASPPSARHLVYMALGDGRSPIEALAAAGFDASGLSAFADMEENSAPEVDVRPDHAPESQRRAIGEFDASARARPRIRAWVWRTLAEAAPSGRCERVTLEREADGPSEFRVRVFGCKSLPDDAPLLLIDADADPAITAKLAPRARFVTIEAAPNGEIIQVSDRTLSATWLIRHKRADLHRAQLRRLVEAEVARSSGPVLLVATKAVLRTLHRDQDPASEVSDHALLKPLFGATPRWFGPRMRGINDYKDVETVVIVGRLEPDLGSVENQLRSLHGDTGEPLALLARDAQGNATRCQVQGAIRASGGARRNVKVATHPDPRGAALLAQMREAGSTQAIARIRAVGATTAKRILVLSSVPLDLPVTRTVRWDDLLDSRLARCLFDADGNVRTTGLRLSAAGLAADAPHEFPSVAAAASWRRGRTTKALVDEVLRIGTARGLPMTGLALSVPGQGGKTTPALVLAPRRKGLAVAKAFWPQSKARLLWSHP